jgi:ClpP class serine protease
MKARTQKRAAAYLPRGIMAVNPKAFGEEFFLMGGDVAEAPFRREGDAAIVDICGPLFSKAHWCWDSYEDILERVGAAFKSDAARVVMCLDSPGGDAAGCLEAARMLRAMALTAGKPLIAWTETQACSAAYALACAATEIYCTPTGCLGSIGIIDAFVDVTAQDAAYGMRYTFVTSGARKADGNPHVPTSKDALAVKQGQIDTLAALFFGLVEELRGVPASAVQALQAGVFYGADAVSAGLANETRVWSEVISNSQSGGGLMAKSTLAGIGGACRGRGRG